MSEENQKDITLNDLAIMFENGFSSMEKRFDEIILKIDVICSKGKASDL